MGDGDGVLGQVRALDGVLEKLVRGAKVADVGCGLGASTVVMAQAFPKSRFFAYDAHQESIEIARQRAAEAGVGDRVTFDVASDTAFPGREYDLVCHVDCVGAAHRVKEVLAPGGTWMIVAERFDADRLRKMIEEAGFSSVRLAVEIASNAVLEAKL
jgi:16S rRNA G1207 methylase RsmC